MPGVVTPGIFYAQPSGLKLICNQRLLTGECLKPQEPQSIGFAFARSLANP
ncbi:hypothetical protein P3T22_001983 [Paraburkholderia sp. GAS348]